MKSSDKKPRAYEHRIVEAKWRKVWTDAKLDVADIVRGKKPFYNLMMFPYPSAEGLHVGNMYAFTGSDIYGRFKRMQGYNVFEPIGLDGFGIHSENYALKIGKHPMDQAVTSQKNFYHQLHTIGAMYDWTRTVETYDPNYYKWTQWLFVQMFQHGLAYRGTGEVNWCPSDKTVLADEQVIDGRCERCGNIIEKKLLEQWFFRITAYAGKLLENLSTLDWSEKVKIAQKNWIGRSKGMIISFKTSDGGNVRVFTTRPDTLNSVTFLATSKLYEKGSKEKVGRENGRYAIDPLSGRKLLIWDTNYVAPDYGTGIIMGVPGHDERDMEFARKYHIDIVKKAPDEKLWQTIPKNGWGNIHVNYHLRDWLISRQRYWGPPIPMIFCEACAGEKKGERKDMLGWYSVPENELPVLLPRIPDYKPGDDGIAPLGKHKEFYHVACPGCGRQARRETDVSDTFLDSSWYFLRYPSPRLKQAPFDPAITKKWLPVDMYTGGAEHSVLHLLYSRFVWKALRDWGYLDFSARGGPASGWDEPFTRFFAHGLVIKEGAKMSKSKGNVVTPDEYIANYGADSLRLYLMFMGPYDAGGDFRDSAMEGMARWTGRVWRMALNSMDKHSNTSSANVKKELERLVKKVGEDIERRHYNTAIASMMEFTNVVSDEKSQLSTEDLKTFVKLLAPFAPYLAEELWFRASSSDGWISVHTQSWPTFDASAIQEETVKIVVQVNGKLRDTISVKREAASVKEEIEKLSLDSDKVQKFLAGKKPQKVIFVPERLINFVV